MLRLGRAPAKLNLALELTGRRPNGYHELASISQTVDWSDVVGVDPVPPSRPGEPCRLLVYGPQASHVPHGPDNILLKAVRVLRERGLANELGRVVLEKRIPTQSGLGGGSADAAALIRLAATGHEPDELLDAALACGADVPFALTGGAAMVTGIGEELSPLPPLGPSLFLVVLLARISTAQAYAAVQLSDFKDGSRISELAGKFREGTRPDPGLFGSDLLPAALRVSPQLCQRWDALRAATPGVSWAMTGSGGAFFTPIDEPASAAGTARAVAGACPGALIRAVVTESGWPSPI